MPRRREVPKREILPDPKFNNVELAKFVNVLMTRGKKSVAERIIYGALDTIKSKSGKDPIEVFSQGGAEREADRGSEEPARRRRELPGARGSASGAPRGACDALDPRGGAEARREVDDGAPRRRATGKRPKAVAVR